MTIPGAEVEALRPHVQTLESLMAYIGRQHDQYNHLRNVVWRGLYMYNYVAPKDQEPLAEKHWRDTYRVVFRHLMDLSSVAPSILTTFSPEPNDPANAVVAAHAWCGSVASRLARGAAGARDAFVKAMSRESEDGRALSEYRDGHPGWREVRADGTYNEIARRYAAAMNALPKELRDDPGPNHPDCRKWVYRAFRVERHYGADRTHPWDLADTPERFIKWLEWKPVVQWQMSAELDFLEQAFTKAVDLARALGLTPPPPPSRPTPTKADGTAYLLTLRTWANLYRNPVPLVVPTEHKMSLTDHERIALQIHSRYVERSNFWQDLSAKSAADDIAAPHDLSDLHRRVALTLSDPEAENELRPYEEARLKAESDGRAGYIAANPLPHPYDTPRRLSTYLSGTTGLAGTLADKFGAGVQQYIANAYSGGETSRLQQIYIESRARMLEFQAIAPSVIHDVPAADIAPKLGIQEIWRWCSCAMEERPEDYDIRYPLAKEAFRRYADDADDMSKRKALEAEADCVWDGIYPPPDERVNTLDRFIDWLADGQRFKFEGKKKLDKYGIPVGQSPVGSRQTIITAREMAIRFDVHWPRTATPDDDLKWDDHRALFLDVLGEAKKRWAALTERSCGARVQEMGTPETESNKAQAPTYMTKTETARALGILLSNVSRTAGLQFSPSGERVLASSVALVAARRNSRESRAEPRETVERAMRRAEAESLAEQNKKRRRGR